MSDIKLGTIPAQGAERDAIHVAIIPVCAAERLKPGQHVGFIDQRHGDKTLFGVCSEPIGIVDPFLERSVERGEWFYLLLYQNTVTGMSHHWEHPAFGVTLEKKRSEEWLEDLAAEIGLSYDHLIEEIPSGYINTGDRECYGARDSADIQRHFEIATGMKAPREIGFRCAC